MTGIQGTSGHANVNSLQDFRGLAGRCDAPGPRGRHGAAFNRAAPLSRTGLNSSEGNSVRGSNAARARDEPGLRSWETAGLGVNVTVRSAAVSREASELP
jgi:hypothetical protein